MTTASTGSAKIYQFTPRRRDTGAGSRGQGQLLTLRRSAVQAAPAICVGAWYHEAAMREENAGRKG